MKILSRQNLNRTHVACTFTFLLISIFSYSVQAQKEVLTKLSVGVNATVAPTLKYSSRTGSGFLVGVFGDLELGRAIGRLQYSRLVSATLSSEDSRKVESGYSANASVGYSLLLLQGKLEVPIMATAGAARLEYSSNGSTFLDRCMQIGLTVSPHYQVSDRIYINVTGRYLQGIEIAGGGQIDQIDISAGIRYTIF